ncbi:hypothetical protein AVEN_256865-1 [Araneus ventricosus]|uniref:Uncharacterized protein n=1 Tax=Araneus ventricosus TaxID=182803 RepID=A0A4Y2RJJ9_ARAVE|nr:hypothetical protein AVEN_256865-1 [Araneus ventricosus]
MTQQITNLWLIVHIFASDIHTFLIPCNNFKKPSGKNRCPERERCSSQPAVPLHFFGSDVPIVFISMREKVESLMEQDWDCKTGQLICPIPGDECVLLCPLLYWILHYRLRTKPLDSRALVSCVQ